MSDDKGKFDHFEEWQPDTTADRTEEGKGPESGETEKWLRVLKVKHNEEWQSPFEKYPFGEAWQHTLRATQNKDLSQEQLQDAELMDLLHNLRERQDGERRTLQRFQDAAKKAPQPAPDLEEQHLQQTKEMGERFAEERKRYIREHEEAKRIFAEMQGNSKRRGFERGHDQGPKL